MSLSIGIIGLPNVGKSTLFNALLKSELAEVANYAFTTIEPNIGIVEVPDERLNKLAEIEHSAKIVPAAVKFVDIAGIIAGAHKGEGLGNKFLSHIREVDAIAMVVRLFEDKDVIHVSHKTDPKNDIETIMLELVLADLETLEKKISAIEKDVRSGLKTAILEREAFAKIQKCLENNRPAIEAHLSDEELKLASGGNFLTLKPFLYIFNVSEEMASDHAEDLIDEFEIENLVKPDQAIVVSAKIEAELGQMTKTDQELFLADLGLEEPGLNRLSRAAYKELNLISFFTAGEMEARAWTINRGDKAPQAAGKIHSDFEKKFIKAEVVNYYDFVALGGWNGLKGTGKVRLEGRDYVMQEGDVVFVHHG